MLNEKVRDEDWYRRAAEIEDEFPLFSIGPRHMVRYVLVQKALDRKKQREFDKKCLNGGQSSEKYDQTQSQSD